MREVALIDGLDTVLAGFDAIEANSHSHWRWALGGRQTIQFCLDENEVLHFKIKFPLPQCKFSMSVNGNEIYSATIDTPSTLCDCVEIVRPSDGIVRIEISTSKWNTEESRFTADARPLAYCVENFFLLKKQKQLTPPTRDRSSFTLRFLRSSRKPIAIVYGMDGGYFNPAVASAHSLLENSDPATVKEIFFLQSGVNSTQRKIMEEALRAFKKTRLHWIDVDASRFSGFKLGISYISSAAWFRFLAPDLVPETFDRAVYLDCDTTVLHPVEDLLDLYDARFDVQACQDNLSSFAGLWSTGQCFGQDGIKESDQYFNSGVLLMNLKSWREKNITERIFTFAAKHPDALGMAEQNVFNIVLHGSIGLLPKEWNAQFALSSLLKDGQQLLKQKIKIFHYTTIWKPWGPGRHFPESGFFHNAVSRLPADARKLFSLKTRSRS